MINWKNGKMDKEQVFEIIRLYGRLMAEQGGQASPQQVRQHGFPVEEVVDMFCEAMELLKGWSDKVRIADRDLFELDQKTAALLAKLEKSE